MKRADAKRLCLSLNGISDGRSLGDNLCNLRLHDECNQVLADMGIS